MSRSSIITFIFIFFFNFSANAKELKIVAVVGNKIITNYDIEQRINLVYLNSKNLFGKKKSKIVKGQIREILINEKLQTLSALSLGLEIDERKINKAFANLANQNNLFLNDFIDFLKRKNIVAASLKNQIRSSLYWQSIIVNKIRPQIIISDLEVAEYLDSIGKKGNFEYKINILKFPITSNEEKEELYNFAEELYQKIIRKKIKFSKINKEFGTNGKNTPWLLYKDIEDSLKEELLKLDKGGLSKPIKTDDAIYLFKLIDKKALVKSKNNLKKDKIRQKLFLQKIEIRAENYLRNIRQQYLIERKKL